MAPLCNKPTQHNTRTHTHLMRPHFVSMIAANELMPVYCLQAVSKMNCVDMAKPSASSELLPLGNKKTASTQGRKANESERPRRERAKAKQRKWATMDARVSNGKRSHSHSMQTIMIKHHFCCCCSSSHRYRYSGRERENTLLLKKLNCKMLELCVFFFF